VKTQQVEASKQLVDVDRLVFNSWNPNVLQGGPRDALKADMKAHGPLGIDPIKVCPQVAVYPGSDVNRLLVLDGEQRVKLATELGWTRIPAEVDYTIHDEEEAMLVTWRKDVERGSFDPFKEGAMFKSLVEKGRTQEQVAKKFGITQETVSKRIGLVVLAPAVIQIYRTKPSITVSHLEPLISLPEKAQVQLAKGIVEEDLSSREIEREAKNVREELAKEKELQEAVAKSEFKVCPSCKKPPVQVHYEGLPWVRCQVYDSSHCWSLKTGKTLQEKYADERKASRSENSSAAHKGPDQFVRTTHEISEFQAAFGAFVRELVPNLGSLDSVTLSGKTADGVSCHLQVSLWPNATATSFSYREYGSKKSYEATSSISFTLESKKYEVKSLKDYKTVITGGYIRSEKDRTDLEARAMEFLKKYGSKPPPTKKTPGKAGPIVAKLNGALARLERDAPLPAVEA
jgi:ParB-like chromosome segregation protein Spo0J